MGRWAVVVAAAGLLGAGAGETHSRFASAATNAENAFSAAASFCVSTTATAGAAADTYVDGALLAQGSTFGTATQLHVRSDTLGSRRSLVRFALPSPPSHCSVASATLRLNAASATSGRTLQAFRAAASWTETGVTWSNQPGVTGTAATAASGTGWRTWDVTAHVQAMYAGANNGFVVRDASEGALVAASQVFSSREGSNAPELVIVFD